MLQKYNKMIQNDGYQLPKENVLTIRNEYEFKH